MLFNLSNLLLLILIDIFGINKLWFERTDRRVLHHLLNSNYNKNKIPYLKFFKKLINVKEENNKLIINGKKFNFNNIEGNGINTYNKLLSNYLGGQYSKKSTLYYNDFIEKDKNNLLVIGESLKKKFENELKKDLFFGDSDFKTVLLRYEGESASFTWHYDTENINCYRSLTLIRKNSTIPKFYYMNSNNELDKINYDLGDTLFFKGSQTYHMVENSNDKYTIRWMLGFQFCEFLDKKKEKSLCSELRGANIFTILKIFIPIILPIIIIIKFNPIKTFDIYLNYYLIINIILLMYMFIKNKVDLKTYITYYIYNLIYFDPISSFGYINYILITE